MPGNRFGVDALANAYAPARVRREQAVRAARILGVERLILENQDRFLQDSNRRTDARLGVVAHSDGLILLGCRRRRDDSRLETQRRK
jgi:hypothetical protein